MGKELIKWSELLITIKLKQTIMNVKCERCSDMTNVTTGSIFNTEMICIPCKTKESNHPDYKRAKDIEMNEVRQGNYNFEGIGKPNNL